MLPMRSHIKSLILASAKAAGMYSLVRQRNRHKLRILAYHGVDDLISPVNYDGFMVHPEVFRAQMEHLNAYYNVISLDDLYIIFNEGTSLPDRSVVITFDDGYRNNYTHALPVLRKFHFPAAFFITTGFLNGSVKPWWYVLRSAVTETAQESVPCDTPVIGSMSLGGASDRKWVMVRLEEKLKALDSNERQKIVGHVCRQLNRPDHLNPYPFMTWTQVEALHREGMTIGAHTLTHCSLQNEELDRMQSEIQHSVTDLNNIGVTPTWFAYPYGLAPDQVNRVELLKKMNMVGSLTTECRFVDGLNSLWDLPRISITANHEGAVFESCLSGFNRMMKG